MVIQWFWMIVIPFVSMVVFLFVLWVQVFSHWYVDYAICDIGSLFLPSLSPVFLSLSF